MHGEERREGWYSRPADVDGPFMGLRAEPQENPENRGTGKGTPVPDYRANTVGGLSGVLMGAACGAAAYREPLAEV